MDWPVLFLTITMILASDVNGQTVETGDGFWRTQHMDDVVVMCIVSEMHGHPVTFDSMCEILDRKTKSESSMLDLKNAAEEMGLSATICKPKANQLDSATPLIVLSEHELGVEGRFDILLSISTDRALLINGDTAELYWAGIDNFKSGWTGHAILIEKRWCTSVWHLVAAIGGILAALSLYFSSNVGLYSFWNSIWDKP